MKLEEFVNAMAERFYQRTGKRVLCERCFIVTDPTCPTAPHVCDLEESLKNPETKKWVMEKLADKVEMRRIKKCVLGI